MEIDARGKACPTPVILTKKALGGITEGVLTVIVDNAASKENICRFARSQGCTYEVSENGNDFIIEVVKGYACEVPQKNDDHPPVQSPAAMGKTVLYIPSDVIGTGDETLGQKLMVGFIENIKNLDHLPGTVILVNSGVFLATKIEKTVAALNALTESGVEVLSCGTCLEHYDLLENLKTGVVADAYTIMQAMFGSEKVIRL